MKGADGDYLLPLYDDEAVWIGVLRKASSPPHELMATGWRAGRPFNMADGHGGLDSAEPLPTEPFLVLPGLPGGEPGFLPFARGGRAHAREAFAMLEFDARQAGPAPSPPPARVRLVSPGVFTDLTGHPAPPPADPGAGYTGWRLP